MRFEELLDKHRRGYVTQAEAAEMLGVCERTFRRWETRYRDDGPGGLRDGRVGKPSSRRAAEDELLRILGVYREHYQGFTVKHFHELAQKRHGYLLGEVARIVRTDFGFGYVDRLPVSILLCRRRASPSSASTAPSIASGLSRSQARAAASCSSSRRPSHR
ncbi:MAG: helix-turn-helix domain-containing protein [Sneathiellaceae bacterium]